jgi:hypothetical protein
MWRPRKAWLSLTPEPERELPEAIATLRAGGPPSAAEVARERERAERLVLRGSRRQWMRWLRETRRLAAENRDAAGSSSARGLALDVLENHHALMLGLPGGPDRGADEERALVAQLKRRPDRGEP